MLIFFLLDVQIYNKVAHFLQIKQYALNNHKLVVKIIR